MHAIVTGTLAAGAEYVLARRINQDPLEAYFGQHRRRGRRYDAPTVSAFASTAKTLDTVKFADIMGSNVKLNSRKSAAICMFRVGIEKGAQF